MSGWEYRPAWQAEWEPVDVVRVRMPGGWLDRLFGGSQPVYVVSCRRGVFATRRECLRETV